MISRRGEEFVLKASGYWTPRRRSLWTSQTGELSSWTLLPLMVFAMCFVYTFNEPSVSSSWPFVFGSVFVSILLLPMFGMIGPIEDLLGRILLGKKTIIEFSTSEVVIYRHGYGLSFPLVIARSDEEVAMADIDEHDHHDDAYHVRLLVAGESVVVADVQTKQYATAFANAIMATDAKLHGKKKERQEVQEEEYDLPE